MTKVGIIDDPEPNYSYGTPETYAMGAEFLADCEMVEDWGCGRGYFRNFIGPDHYRGVDMGVDSLPYPNPFADVVVNLTDYRSDVDGIFMRHVLEHNYLWRKILANALASSSYKVFIAIFTPWSNSAFTEILCLHGPPEYEYDPPVPNLAFAPSELLGEIRGWTVDGPTALDTGTQYGSERVLLLTKEEI